MRHRITLLAVLLLAAAPTRGAAQQPSSEPASPPVAPSAGVGAAPDLWEPPVLPQPFDTAPFRPIRVPDWVAETMGCGYTLSGMDSRARAAAASHGVTLSEIGFVDPFYAYYDSELLHRRSPHVPRDRLLKDLAEYERLGVRILGVYPPCLQSEVYERHPEWRRIATNATEIPSVDLQQSPHGGMLCLLGPYGDFVIDVLAEILTQFPQVDAFSFDGLHYGGVCYCRHCRDGFRRDLGGEIPNADMNDPAFRRYQHWADRRMEDLVRRMQTRLKSINPEVALVTWSTNAGRFGHFLSIPRNMPARMNLLFDAPDQEFWMDETNRGATILPAITNAYIWALTNHRTAFSEPYLLSHGNPYGKDSFPPSEIQRRMLLAATYGAMPSIAVAQPPRLQEHLYACMDEIQRRKPWLTHKSPEPWGAILVSDNTRNFYGRAAGQVEERYLANVFGAFRAAMEEHLQFTLINDWNLTPEELAKYRVLVLPNCAAIDDRQAAAIEAFVHAGGGLIASLDTSLFNEFGDPRADFALAELLGVAARGLIPAESSPPDEAAIDVNFARSIGPDYWEKRKNVFDFRLDPDSPVSRGKLRTYIGGEPVTFKGPAVRVDVTDASARVWGTLQGKSATAAAFPAIVARSHGEGRVVYLAAGLDAAYYLYPYPYQRLILKEAFEWVAWGGQPIRVDAPMCVHATMLRQASRGRQRLLVHLFNDLNTTAHHALPVDDVPLREETVPIHDIRISFDRSYPIDRIHWEPAGQDLRLDVSEEQVYVTVPRLDIHGIVVVELGP